MKEPIQYHNQEELNKFLEKGVIIPEPQSVKIESSSKLPQIGKGTCSIHFPELRGNNPTLMNHVKSESPVQSPSSTVV